MQFQVEILVLRPRHVFRISRGDKREVRNVILRVEEGGCVGFGEASPNAFYGESADDVARRLLEITPWMEGIRVRTADDIVQVWPEIWNRVAPSRAAACAIDLALWDLLGKHEDKSVCNLVWREEAKPVLSCTTLGISDSEEMECKLAEITNFPLIKVKTSAKGSIELVRWIRERTSARLFVDANASWDIATFIRNTTALAELGVEMIEQPLPMEVQPILEQRKLLEVAGIPLFADESCVIPADVERLPEWYRGFNIKLVKCGGLTPALEMLRLGRERGLKTMTGCMLESSVLIAAGAILAQKTDYADLDGSWLLQDEPFQRVEFLNGILHLRPQHPEKAHLHHSLPDYLIS